MGLGGAGTDAPVFIRIYDNNDRKSDAFQLKYSTKHRNKFERNQTGEANKHSVDLDELSSSRSFYYSYSRIT